jgi:hypothetical protein
MSESLLKPLFGRRAIHPSQQPPHAPYLSIYTYIKVGSFRELLGMPPHLLAL